MPSDLFSLAQHARASIDVPRMPAELTAGARAATASSARRGRPRLVAAAIAGVSLVAVAAAAAEIVMHSDVVFNRATGTVTLGFDNRPGLPHRPYLRPKHPLPPPPPPTAQQIAAAVRAADFPVTMPVGVPGDRGPRALLAAGTSVIFVTYDLPGAWRRDDHLLRIILANPRAVSDGTGRPAEKHTFEVQVGSMKGALRWHVGGEDVLVFRSTMTPAETEHLHSAMLAAAAKRE